MEKQNKILDTIYELYQNGDCTDAKLGDVMFESGYIHAIRTLGVTLSEQQLTKIESTYKSILDDMTDSQPICHKKPWMIELNIASSLDFDDLIGDLPSGTYIIAGDRRIKMLLEHYEQFADIIGAVAYTHSYTYR